MLPSLFFFLPLFCLFFKTSVIFIMVASWMPDVTAIFIWVGCSLQSTMYEAQWKQLELNTSSKVPISLRADRDRAHFWFMLCTSAHTHTQTARLTPCFVKHINVAQFISTDRQSFQHMFLPYWSQCFVASSLVLMGCWTDSGSSRRHQQLSSLKSSANIFVMPTNTWDALSINIITDIPLMTCNHINWNLFRPRQIAYELKMAIFSQCILLTLFGDSSRWSGCGREETKKMCKRRKRCT